MNEITNKLNRVMEDCENLAEENGVGNQYINYLRTLLSEKIHGEMDKVANNEKTDVKEMASEIISENLKIPMEKTKSGNDINKSNEDLFKHTTTSYDNITKSENKLSLKYGLKYMSFNGKRYTSKHYCILLNKEIQRHKAFEYIQSLRKFNKRCVISINEDEKDFYVIKCKMVNRPSFQTSRKFKPKSLNEDVMKQVHIYEVEKKKYFMENFKSLTSNILPSITMEYLKKVMLVNGDFEAKSILEILLKENYKELKIKFINEYNCSLMMAMLLFACSNVKCKDKSFVYSFEKTMQIGSEIRRCDAIYIHKDILFIFEWKNNVYKKECPLDYIDKREYVDFVMAYFRENEPNMISKIKTIRRIGIEFFGKSKNYDVKVSTQEDIKISNFMNYSANQQSEEDEVRLTRNLKRKRNRKQNQTTK
jgi:hypothetical protein